MAPRCSLGWWAWSPRETGTHSAFLPSETWAGLLHCSHRGQPLRNLEPEEEKGLSSSALCFPILPALLPGLTPPRAPSVTHGLLDHLTWQGGDGGDMEAQGRAAREKGALPSEPQGSKL